MPSIGRSHHYAVDLEWTGNRGAGTTGYRDYDRDCVVRAAGAPDIPGSADRAFRGDPSRWNPEQLLVAAVAQCHMLWYLHHAAVNGVVVVSYTDAAAGELQHDPSGGGRFTDIVLRPVVTVAGADQVTTAEGLHPLAHRDCFIAASLAVPVRLEPVVRSR